MAGENESLGGVFIKYLGFPRSANKMKKLSKNLSRAKVSTLNFTDF